MINLLPSQQKREILKEERWKLYLILGILFLFFLISLALVLLSVKIYISGQALSQKILVDSEEKEFKVSEAKAVEEEIKLTNQNLTKLNSFYKNQPDLTGLLEEISEILPEGTHLITLSLLSLPREKNKLQVSLGGYCPTRDNLLSFKKNLEAQAQFSEIYFPPQSWVKSKDIEFSTNFKVEY